MKHTHKHWTSHLAALLIAALCLAGAAPTAAAENQDQEVWYVVTLGGDKAGHATMAQFTDDDGNLVNTSTMLLTIKRGTVEMVIEQETQFVETADHEPIEASSRVKFALTAVETHIKFGKDKWVKTSTTAGQTQTQQIDPPKDDWLTPGQLAKRIEKALKDGDKQIAVKMLEPSAGTTPIEIKMKYIKKENIEVFGKVVPATRWDATVSMLPGITTSQWTDDKGNVLRQQIPMLPGMEIEMLLADKRLALAKFDAPEMIAASMIKPDKPIKHPRTLNRAVFELSAEDLKENASKSLPSAGFQEIKWIDGDTARVTVDLSEPISTTMLKDEMSAYLEATTTLNYKDEAIQKLNAKTMDRMRAQVKAFTPDDLYDYARQTTKIVRDHIDEKNLSVGFATASEVARTKQGDCTEHACLLTAMIRGLGLPARTVTGIVYADGFEGHQSVFVFHMWTQVYLRNNDRTHRWVDLDAAAPGDIDGFDATHIALSTSAMRDEDQLNDMVAMMPLLQGLKVKVIELQWAE